jgi:hypothetical protein
MDVGGGCAAGAGAISAGLPIETTRWASIHCTVAPRDSLTNLSGTMVRPLTVKGATSSSAGRPFTRA